LETLNNVLKGQNPHRIPSPAAPGSIPTAPTIPSAALNWTSGVARQPGQDRPLVRPGVGRSAFGAGAAPAKRASRWSQSSGKTSPRQPTCWSGRISAKRAPYLSRSRSSRGAVDAKYRASLFRQSSR